VLPISGARFSALRGNAVPFAVIASTDALFALSGLFNVVLFALTRPGLIPRNRWCAAHSVLQARATSAGRIERHLSGDGIDFGADGIDTVERNRPD